MRSLLALLALLAVAAAAAPTVETECGPISGSTLEIGDASVRQFLGVKYGAAPLGPRRFAQPVALKAAGECWSGTFNATSFGEYCLQSGQFRTGGGEDCLFLNVWAPDGADNLPVMVYSYGGDNTDGKTNTYPLDVLAGDGNVVTVSFNYRIGLPGYLSLDELLDEDGCSGNYGLYDHLEALRWVQRNIQKFGGDPSRVTLFGQSSGGTNGLALLGAPAAKGLFHRMISFSGSPNITMDGATARRNNRGVLETVGCAGLDKEATLFCLRNNVTSEALGAATPASWDTSSFIWELPLPQWASNPAGPDYQGIVNIDGCLLKKPALESIADPEVDVPVVFGNLAEEPDAQPTMIVAGLTDEQWRQNVTETFSPWGQGAGEKVLSMYESQLQTGGPQRSYDALLADYGISCGSAALANASSTRRSSAAPVYWYFISGRPSHPIWAFDTDYESRWALHSWDIIAGLGHWDLWSISEGKPTFVPQESDMMFAQMMRQWMVEFAATGRVEGWRHTTEDCAGRQTSGSPAATVILSNGTVVCEEQLKEKECSMWNALGFDQRYWWAN